MENRDVNGRQVRVNLAQPKGDRPAGGEGGFIRLGLDYSTEKPQLQGGRAARRSGERGLEGACAQPPAQKSRLRRRPLRETCIGWGLAAGCLMAAVLGAGWGWGGCWGGLVLSLGCQQWRPAASLHPALRVEC